MREFAILNNIKQKLKFISIDLNTSLYTHNEEMVINHAVMDLDLIVKQLEDYLKENK